MTFDTFLMVSFWSGIRMSQYSALLAKNLGWSADSCELMLHASPMHDIGKIGIPDAILLKPGKLDPQEWEIMKTHATIGASLLEDETSDLLHLASEIALSHHEKWDGGGYPKGLFHTAIPQSGCIVSVADVFDALTSERPYKQAWPVEEAVDYIQNNAGKHFDHGSGGAFHEVPARDSGYPQSLHGARARIMNHLLPISRLRFLGCVSIAASSRKAST
jgi:response regulator RpfG family c-di-GMP phosphodiesterase